MTNDHEAIEHLILDEHPNIKSYFFDIDKKKASSAYAHTSFSPEKRGAWLRVEYANSLLHDKKTIEQTIHAAKKSGADCIEDADAHIEVWFDEHRKTLQQKYLDYIHSQAQVLSWMITGPANFPTALNEKRSHAADNHYRAIGDFRKNSRKRILKILLPWGDSSTTRIDDPNSFDKIKAKIELLEKKRTRMKKTNALVRKYFRKGNPDISDEKRFICIDKLCTALGYQVGTVEKLLKPNCMNKVIPFEGFQLSNMGAEIRRLKGRLSEINQLDSVTIDDTFDNGIEVNISHDYRICIHFGYKPEATIREQLKKSYSFHFSKNRDNAWVRKLTQNAYQTYVNDIRPWLKALPE